MPSTYEPIATNTLGTAVSTVTFSSITGTYTDLVLVFQGGSSIDANARLRVNGDSSTNYSWTQLAGNGTGAASFSGSSDTSWLVNRYAYLQNNLNANMIFNFNNYSNTTTNKTVINRANSAANGADTTVGLWRSTSAITSITFSLSGGNYIVGSTFTLYGIKAA
jgi:hypothetical protein